jgi:uncharacterized protein (TIGR03437 family)
MLRHLAFLFAAAVLSISSAFAQLPDLTTLNGVYNIRYLGVSLDPLSTPVSFQGSFTFDGKGGFTVAGQGVTSGAALKFRTTGTYHVLSSGLFYLDNPFDPTAANGTTFYGGIGANKMISASSTESLYCDLLIGVPAATSATAATLTGNYRVAHMEFLSGDLKSTRNAFFSMSANGSGSLGNVTIAGTAQNLKNVATTQTSTGATYTVTTNGTGTLVLPAPSGVTAANTLLSGNKVLYVSQDGNFFIAGSPTGYDMEIGVKAGGSALNGLYWTAYLNNYAVGSDLDGIYSAAGSANQIASANNLEIGHDRTNSELFLPYDSTFSDNFTFDTNGTVTYAGFGSFAIGANGDIAIGAGDSTNYLINIYLKAPAMTGTGVFLNPQGIVNGANNTPITTQVAPGEIITLFGTGLGPASPVTASAPFPTTLGGVQVLINNTPAPVYSVTATQISAVVPYTAPTDGSFLNIQVVFNGAQSNVVNVYSGESSPGLFTIPPGGPFSGAIVHPADGSIVTSANPAKVGETVAMFLTGLGAVTGNVTAGSAAPTNPLATLKMPIFIAIDGVSATVQFAGLAPGFGGLYQVNVTIPAGVSKGDVGIFIETTSGDPSNPDTNSINSEATIPIG